MKQRQSFVLLSCVLMLALMFSGCFNQENGGTGASASTGKTFVILSGSENKLLEPFVKEFGEKQGVSIEVKYKGSVDIMLALREGEGGFDAVWPANSLWIRLAENSSVKHEESIFRSPVVLAVKQSKADALGFKKSRGG